MITALLLLLLFSPALLVYAKPVILTFDDNYRSQYEFVAPLLEKYGFNATFFIYCQLRDDPDELTWSEIRDLDKRGFDIQSHSMTHMNLEHASNADLVYEISESRYCIEDEIMSEVNVFATPFASGDDNSTILQAIRDAGYDFARSGYSNNFELNCDQKSAAGCELFNDNGTIKEQNKYNIPTTNINGMMREMNNSIPLSMNEFADKISANVDYNGADNLTSFPVLVYHNFTEKANADPKVRSPNMPYALFEQQMKWLYDHGYTAHSMADLTYDNATHVFRLNGERFR